MSYEIVAVVPASCKPTSEGWLASLRTCGFDVTFQAAFDPHQAAGFVEMTINGNESGCEIDFEPDGVGELAEEYPALADYAANANLFVFSWGGDMTEMSCGVAAAASLAVLCDSVVF